MSHQGDKERNKVHEEQVVLANTALEQDSAATAVAEDNFRLYYHLMPPAGWMNDPNGLIYFNQEYHVFYQHYPYEPKWGPMHWGHAKSKDLVNWEHLPVALAPSENYDMGETGGYGCWSGSAVDDNGVLTLIYTGHVDGRTPTEVQCIATSTDGVTFNKAANNPVIACAPEEGGFGFRDPKVWQHAGVWYMVIGYGKDGLGKALLYKSSDLRDWSYIGVAAESDGTMGDMWECPDLFPLGNGNDHVLVISPMNMGTTKTMYLIGKLSYESGVFDYRYAERLDYGFDFYAPQTFVDGQGRRILIGWMNIWGAQMPEQEHGWMGAFTLPRELTLSEDGTLRIEPVAELKAMRGTHHRVSNLSISADTEVPLPEIHGDALELIAVFNTDLSAGDAEFGLLLRCSEDGSEYTEVSYSTADRKLRMDRSHSGAGEAGVSEVQLTPLEDGRIKLQIFIDRSSVEIFANNGLKTVTNRIYPKPDSLGIKLFARNGEVSLESLDAWKLITEG
ncbi:glycoside hydrolase family 32 protein [Paenibacillus alginolyticus]|uniref:glycoside hydrolase family 32 protein n=1 Tax=Paenibacillus alginolyticus TaxID=59839 RepID=UPI00042443DD|nr:glycoside hydrolase family 32 protein [Paenibacillus alginolyticus]MCY9666186.1 glycoside hydrolase family 32 protein [Paenibacillus alginolyticus]